MKVSGDEVVIAFTVDLRLPVRDVRDDILMADASAQYDFQNFSLDAEFFRDGVEVVEFHEKGFSLLIGDAVGAVEKAFLDEIADTVFTDLVSFLKLYHFPIVMVRAAKTMADAEGRWESDMESECCRVNNSMLLIRVKTFKYTN